MFLRLLGACLALSLARVGSLRIHGDNATARLAGPPFLLCGQLHIPNNESCGTDRPARNLTGLPFRSIEGASKLAVEGGRAPVIVVIGANDFHGEERGFQRLFASMSTVARESFRIVAVEPFSGNQRVIQERAKRLGIPSGQVSIVQAVVEQHCADPEVTFYNLSPALNRPAFGAGGTDYHNRVKPVREVLKQAGIDPDRVDEYIVHEAVPCLTPADLLAKVGAAASDVAYLKVDAEGADIGIASGFLDAGARPAFLMAEAFTGHVCTPFGEHPLVLSLRAAGYLVGGHCDDARMCSKCGSGPSMPQDVLAVDPRFISSPA